MNIFKALKMQVFWGPCEFRVHVQISLHNLEYEVVFFKRRPTCQPATKLTCVCVCRIISSFCVKRWDVISNRRVGEKGNWVLWVVEAVGSKVEYGHCQTSWSVVFSLWVCIQWRRAGKWEDAMPGWEQCTAVGKPLQARETSKSSHALIICQGCEVLQGLLRHLRIALPSEPAHI